ncbi:MAG: hypothetical protein SVU94_03085 [Bacteroidota bacterium]|nr:hypothetical protein [Bacteroidota bacterium]
MKICFESGHFDEISNLIQSKKIQQLQNVIEEQCGQRTIRFFDTDKNLVEIGETFPVFIKRLKNKGLYVNEINKKTGVPADKIKKLIK